MAQLSLLDALGLMRTGRRSRPGSLLAKRALCSCLFVLLSGNVLIARENTQRTHSDPVSKTYDPTPPNYLYGSVVEKNLIRDEKGKYATNITFQPRYVSELFTESVLFCGNRSDAFDGLEGPVVVTYGRVAHTMVRDVPCFDLVSVDRVQSSQQVLSAK